MAHFDNLSPVDFEELVAELLSAETGLPFRTGASGPDEGVDLMAVTKSGVHVAQCKHFSSSTVSHLRAAAKQEAARLAATSPEYRSYRFATSRRLTHKNKAELARILTPWVNDENEILSGADVTRMLRNHPEIEARHLKLWLTATGQLQRLLNAAAFERSAALIGEIKRFLPVCVETNSFFEAREILEKEGACIISGAPGTGKTTIGRLLVLDALHAGYQPYEVLPESLDDAWQLLSLDERQVFFFDDFLGQTALEGTRRGDSDLTRFIRHVQDDPHRRMVMTTREYILKEAKRASEVLDREIGTDLKIVLPLEGHSRSERARIFYNHVYFSSQLDIVARKSLLADRGYLEIIDHPSYNPRLVEWMTGWSASQVKEEDRADYVRHCLDVLDRPDRIWSHAFEHGLDAWSRVLLFGLLGMPRKTALSDVETLFSSACAARELDITGRKLHHALDALEGSFVSIFFHKEGDEHYVEFANPSVVDFLVDYLLQSPADARMALEGASFFEQVDWLWSHATSPEASEIALSNYRRTFTTPPARGHEKTMHDFPGDISFQASDRVTTFVGHCLDCPDWWGSADAAEWLTARVREWFEHLVDGVLATHADIEWVVALLARGWLDEPKAGARLLELLRGSPEDAYRWMSLADLREQMPSAIDDDQWRAEQQEFLAYAARALRYPGHYLGMSSGLGELREAAADLGLELDPDLVEGADEHLGGEPSGRGQASPHRGRQQRLHGEHRDAITAMFDKLSQEPE